MNTRTILITGCQTGIGKITARYFEQRGWNVAATLLWPDQVTDLPESDHLKTLRLDVEDHSSITAAITQTIERFGAIDVLCNNAGFAVMGVFEAITEAQIHKQFAVNVFGTMAVTRAVLPHMRARRQGLIINLSSSAGRYSWPLLSLYNASKCAIEGFSETLWYELEPFGIGVKVIEPDKIRTEFGRGIVLAPVDHSFQADYGPYTERVLATLDRWEQLHPLAEPETVATAIYTAATDGRKQLRYLVGEELQMMITLKATLSDEQFTRFVSDKFQ